ncbi:hypothetical protein SKAU_G00054270 [Synaphobranchus kaupii]|uniref:Uncharacterized protein n=1 Tax=Synaphobranchus kaupii TaxID=118154 RepID=A0A9Q1G4P1_SYNKA|nr:hypothetical protein SKAU_G00054270 [Synaphobranchus kaupii]
MALSYDLRSVRIHLSQKAFDPLPSPSLQMVAEIDDHPLFDLHPGDQRSQRVFYSVKRWEVLIFRNVLPMSFTYLEDITSQHHESQAAN